MKNAVFEHFSGRAWAIPYKPSPWIVQWLVRGWWNFVTTAWFFLLVAGKNIWNICLYYGCILFIIVKENCQPSKYVLCLWLFYSLDFSQFRQFSVKKAVQCQKPLKISPSVARLAKKSPKCEKWRIFKGRPLLNFKGLGKNSNFGEIYRKLAGLLLSSGAMKQKHSFKFLKFQLDRRRMSGEVSRTICELFLEEGEGKRHKSDKT